MAREFKVEKLSDEFGQYILILKCESCLRERRTTPNIIAHILGWDARLSDVARRMRCAICGAKKCSVRTVPVAAPRRYKSH
jgi:hypothetical protein